MPKLNYDDTICAIATPPGQGAIGMVRMSGPQTLPIIDRCFQARSKKRMAEVPSHTIHCGFLREEDERPIDEVMVSLFRAPRSFTREEMVEISAHGSPVILKKIMERLTSLGARIAEPGEFTRRAFLNGRMDLAQAEAVLDLVRAKSEAGHAQALRELTGGFSQKVGALKERLLRLTAHIEAYIDFPEEEIEVTSSGQFRKEFEDLIREVESLIQSYRAGSLTREGLAAVIVGRPNVGKSSLLNALLGRDRAIVTEVPGTTRDLLQEEITLGGFLIRLIDTAGLREKGSDLVESIGIQRTRDVMREAQLFLMVIDSHEPFTEEDERIYREIVWRPHILVFNKSDLPRKTEPAVLAPTINGDPACLVSAKTGEGIDRLEQFLLKSLAEDGEVSEERVLVTKLRHKKSLEKCLEGLRNAKEAFEQQLSLEFIAVDLRSALEGLGEIVGEMTSQDVLDVIFKEFCIGK